MFWRLRSKQPELFFHYSPLTPLSLVQSYSSHGYSLLNAKHSTFIHSAHTGSTNQTATQSPLGNRGCAVPTDRQRTDKTTLKESPTARMGALLQSADDV